MDGRMNGWTGVDMFASINRIQEVAAFGNILKKGKSGKMSMTQSGDLKFVISLFCILGVRVSRRNSERRFSERAGSHQISEDL